jgi:hypothetical protein
MQSQRIHILQGMHNAVPYCFRTDGHDLPYMQSQRIHILQGTHNAVPYYWNSLASTTKASMPMPAKKVYIK